MVVKMKTEEGYVLYDTAEPPKFSCSMGLYCLSNFFMAPRSQTKYLTVLCIKVRAT